MRYTTTTAAIAALTSLSSIANAQAIQLRIVDAAEYDVFGNETRAATTDPIFASSTGEDDFFENEFYVQALIVGDPDATGLTSISPTLQDDGTGVFSAAQHLNAETIAPGIPGTAASAGLFPPYRSTVPGGNNDPANGDGQPPFWTFLPLNILPNGSGECTNDVWCNVYKFTWFTQDRSERSVPITITSDDGGYQSTAGLIQSGVTEATFHVVFTPPVSPPIEPIRRACCLGDACIVTTGAHCAAAGGEFILFQLDCDVGNFDCADSFAIRPPDLPLGSRRFVIEGPVTTAFGDIFSSTQGGTPATIAIDIDGFTQSTTQDPFKRTYHAVQRVQLILNGQAIFDEHVGDLPPDDRAIIVTNGDDAMQEPDSFELHVSDNLTFSIALADFTATALTNPNLPQRLTLQSWDPSTRSVTVFAPEGFMQFEATGFALNVPFAETSGCTAEVTGNVPPNVGVQDLLAFLGAWFPASNGFTCP